MAALYLCANICDDRLGNIDLPDGLIMGKGTRAYLVNIFKGSDWRFDKLVSAIQTWGQFRAETLPSRSLLQSLIEKTERLFHGQDNKA